MLTSRQGSGGWGQDRQPYQATIPITAFDRKPAAAIAALKTRQIEVPCVLR
jgi:hypothetical protein